MTKTEAMAQIKQLSKQLSEKYKQKQIDTAEYANAYNLLNDALYMLNTGKSADLAESAINGASAIISNAGSSGTTGSGSSSGGMTQEEYAKQKSEMYQKYKNGEITNYAYIQWKKQNDPSKQGGKAAVSAPAAKKAQTPVPKQAAQNAPKTGGMTLAEYNKAKSEMYQKYKNGEITNYAYMQWKKQNNPTYGGSAAAPSPAPAAKKGPTTAEEYKKQLTELQDKKNSGEISGKEFIAMYKELKTSAKDNGVQFKGGKLVEPEPEKKQEPKLPPITDEEAQLVVGELYNMYKQGDLTKDEYNESYKELQKMHKNGESFTDVKLQMGIISPEDAKYEKEEALKAAAAASAPGWTAGGMTDAELKQLKTQLTQKYTDGDITWDELNDIGADLNKLKAAGIGYNEAAIMMDSMADGDSLEKAAQIAGVTLPTDIQQTGGSVDLTDIQSKLLNAFVHDDLTQKEVDQLTDMVNYLVDSGLDKDQIEAQLDSAMNLSIDGGWAIEDAMNVASGYKPGMKAQPTATAGATQEEANQLYDQLLQMTSEGKMTFDEFTEKQNKVMSMKAQGASLDEIKAAVGLDPGTLATEKAVDDLEKELKKVYTDAAKEIKDKLTAFEDAYTDKLTKMGQKLANGEITQAEYEAWVKTQLMTADIMRNKIDQLTGVCLNANQKALGMVNGERLGVFAENANYQSYQLTQDTKVNLMFSIYDENTVEKLVKEKPELLPPKVVNGQKDQAWNREVIANAMVRAIIQGESIPQIARRVANDTASTNMKAMVRYARTAMTAAQNSGRMEMLNRAVGMGIKVKKRWLATLDSRTRDSHRHLDGQTVDVDKPFTSDLGKIMYPGDPAAAPGDVWNCRCTLVYEYEDYPNDPTDNQRLYYDEYVDADGKAHRESKLITDMNYDEWKAAKEGSKLNDLNLAKVKLADLQKQVLKAKISETKVYKDLWKEDVTLADYPDKAAGIAAKRDYYASEIDKYKDAQANGASWATDEKIKELEKKLKSLNEFEKNGKLLQERNAALKEVQDIYDQVGLQKTASANVAAPKAAKKAKKATDGTGAKEVPKQSLSAAGGQKTQFAPDAWSAKTKKAAAKYSSRATADKDLRKELDAEWDSLTDAQKYACWEYTHNSNPMNKPLSGYHDSWNRSNFLGYGNTTWGYEDSWRTLGRNFGKFGKNGHATYHKAITDLTAAIEKTVFKKDRWLVRGSDNGGFAGMLEGAGMDFKQIKSLLDRGNLAEIRKNLIGQKATNHAFTSTGIASDAGFDGEVKYSIFAPKGTKAIYAEPQSYYGNTISGEELYRKGKSYRSVGSEAEVILQRGTTFVIRDIKATGTGIEVEMEIVEQPDYFVHGDEDTYNDGKTRHKR